MGCGDGFVSWWFIQVGLNHQDTKAQSNDAQNRRRKHKQPNTKITTENYLLRP